MNYMDVGCQDDTTEHKFSKVAWRKAGNQYSDKRLTTKTFGALAQLADTMGRLGRNDHVPCVWRRAADLQRVLNVGRDALRARLNELIKDGFLIEVAMHGTPGKRKMYIAKMPDESEANALLSAVEAFRRYRKIPSEVRNALFWEIEHRGLWDFWAEPRCAGFGVFRPNLLNGTRIKLTRSQFPKQIEMSCERHSDVVVTSAPGENRNSKLENPTLKGGKPAFNTSYIENRNQELNRREPPPSPVESSEMLEDAFNSESFDSFLRNFCMKLDINLGESAYVTIVGVYQARFQDTFALRTWIAQKLLRLSAQYKPATIAGYLLSDVEEFFHSSSSSTVKPKQQKTKSDSEKAKPAPRDLDEVREPLSAVQVEWRELLSNSVKPLVSAQTYNAWFHHLRAIRRDQDIWVLTANDEFVLTWIEENFGPLLERVCGELRFEMSH